MPLIKPLENVRTLLELRDPGLLYFVQASKTIMALIFTLALLQWAPSSVRVQALVCTAFVMQCRSGNSRAFHLAIMASSGTAMIILVTLGSALQPYPLATHALLPVVAYGSFYARRHLPPPASYTSFIFFSYVLATAVPLDDSGVAARFLAVSTGILTSLAVTFLVRQGRGPEESFLRVMERFRKRAARFHQVLTKGPGKADEARWNADLDGRYDRLLILLSYGQSLVDPMPLQNKPRFERLLLDEFDVLHSVYALRKIDHDERHEGALFLAGTNRFLRRQARREFHEGRMGELMARLEKAYREEGK